MDDDVASLTRRELLALAAATAMTVPFALREALAQTSLTRTPAETMGPFFPIGRKPIRSTDLTQGPTGRASGPVVHLVGRVLDRAGEPLPGTTVEIWQANAHGRYTHPNDTNPAPLDPNFTGFALQTADPEGRYRFTTIKPGSYPTGEDNWTRPPHIHFNVVGKKDRLVTQMYFPGEPLNGQDRIFTMTPHKDVLVARAMPAGTELEPDGIVLAWDIVLARG